MEKKKLFHLKLGYCTMFFIMRKRERIKENMILFSFAFIPFIPDTKLSTTFYLTIEKNNNKKIKNKKN